MDEAMDLKKSFSCDCGQEVYFRHVGRGAWYQHGEDRERRRHFESLEFERYAQAGIQLGESIFTPVAEWIREIHEYERAGRQVAGERGK